ncbi:MAG: site-specific DNA-methyltransferase [Verrucomicrobia bacterium]|nr:site-specific DNA-methyltransferase [Verrucomicrobiota bacterium]
MKLSIDPSATLLPLFEARASDPLKKQLRGFSWKGKSTKVSQTHARLDDGHTLAVDTFLNEFWTSRQRQAHNLHEISYRACFKPQLPRFFIERLTRPGEVVYDPFMGRGTTPLEAAFLGRVPFGNDINPLSAILLAPRLCPPTVEQVAERLRKMEFVKRITPVDIEDSPVTMDDLLVFYHPDTLHEICALRRYLLERERQGKLDHVDRWIRMVAVNRLTGHSPGFFSVYTMPPNQAVSAKSQRKINERRKQIPPRRHVPELIVSKTRKLLSDCDAESRRILAEISARAKLLTRVAWTTPELPAGSVDLVVTSPPFLDVVDYASDNWLRCWFCNIAAADVKLTVPKKTPEWQMAMSATFSELHRILKPGGHIAFEVGEVLKGTLKLEEVVIPAGSAAGLEPLLVMINSQRFTKTANCWGVDNNAKGTNTNRIVVFKKND